MLQRDEILSRVELKKQKVSVPEWGGDVFVSEMTGMARDAWEDSISKRDKQGKLINVRGKLVAATVVDESGNLIFNGPNDIDRLGQLSSKALDRVCEVAQELNGLTRQALEKTEGNSSAGPSGDSTSV